MLKWISYIPEVLAAIPVAIAFITVLVKQFETPGFGEDKLKAVLSALESGMIGLGFRESIVSMIVKGAAGIIDAFVALKNLIGEFKHEEETP